jgi:large subunit ribosomal protein L9
MVEVMLMADVKKLGKAGAIVKVAPGYARNFLFTQELAAPVTEAAKRKLAKLEAERAKARAERKAAAEELAKKLAGLNVTVSARTVDGTRLYGSVNATDILAAVTADRGVALTRSQLDLPDQLREVGEYNAKIDLGEGVFVPFKVKINDEEAAQA